MGADGKFFLHLLTFLVCNSRENFVYYAQTSGVCADVRCAASQQKKRIRRNGYCKEGPCEEGRPCEEGVREEVLLREGACEEGCSCEEGSSCEEGRACEEGGSCEEGPGEEGSCEEGAGEEGREEVRFPRSSQNC